MLDLTKIQSIAQSYSPQELFAALSKATSVQRV